MRKLVSLLMIVAILAVFVPTAFAAPPAQKGQDYIVLAGDWLAKIANKYLGNPYAWPAIMALTNQKHLTDSTYATIINADLIEPGWKLYVPSKDEAEAFLATYDKNKPEMLYAKGAKGQLVVGSWWTAGGEAEGLNGMFKIYKAKYPDVQIVNATVAGGAGTNFKAILKTRLIGGDPPDTFQLHAGLEVEGYSPEQYLESIDAIYASEGLEQAFPADLLSLLKYKDHYWGVPVNIQRAVVQQSSLRSEQPDPTDHLR